MGTCTAAWLGGAFAGRAAPAGGAQAPGGGGGCPEIPQEAALFGGFCRHACEQLTCLQVCLCALSALLVCGVFLRGIRIFEGLRGHGGYLLQQLLIVYHRLPCSALVTCVTNTYAVCAGTSHAKLWSAVLCNALGEGADKPQDTKFCVKEVEEVWLRAT